MQSRRPCSADWATVSRRRASTSLMSCRPARSGTTTCGRPAWRRTAFWWPGPSTVCGTGSSTGPGTRLRAHACAVHRLQHMLATSISHPAPAPCVCSAVHRLACALDGGGVRRPRVRSAPLSMPPRSRSVRVSYEPLFNGRIGSLLQQATVLAPHAAPLEWLRRLRTSEPAPVSALQLAGGKVVADGILGNSLILHAYFTSIGLLEGRNAADILANTREKFHNAWALAVLVWTPIQCINFYLVPLHLQVSPPARPCTARNADGAPRAPTAERAMPLPCTRRAARARRERGALLGSLPCVSVRSPPCARRRHSWRSPTSAGRPRFPCSATTRSLDRQSTARSSSALTPMGTTRVRSSASSGG